MEQRQPAGIAEESSTVILRLSSEDPSIPSLLFEPSIERLPARHEIQRHSIDAVSLTRRRRAVREDVTEMTAALRAVHFRARHAVAAVRRRGDGPRSGREEAGP